MRILVCDDEKLARDRLVRLLESLDDQEVVAQAATGREAISAVEEQAPDVVLMDIRMPDMDGLEAASHLMKLDKTPAIVFCTAYDEHALEAFRVHAVDYLLKPVNKEALSEALARAKALTHQALKELDGAIETDTARGRQHISARTHKGIELIPIDNVRYFMADQKYVTVRHTGGEVLIDETLKELEDEFADSFVRIHRNALISLRYLEGMELESSGHYQVRLRGVEERLTVSRRHVAGLRKVMQKL